MIPHAPPGDPASMADRGRPSNLREGAYLARLDATARDVLIVGRDIEFPSVCLKCASHQDLVRRRARFQWTPGWARVSVVLCAVVGLVAMALTTHRAELNVPLCARCNGRWTKARVGLYTSLAAIAASLVALRFVDEPRTLLPLVGVLMVGFVVVFLAYVRPRLVHARRIDDLFVELEGCHPDAAQEIAEGSGR